MVSGHPADPAQDWSYACSACGNCCNSAPPLSLSELLYHQCQFIGCLAVRRIRRPRLGDQVGTAHGARGADAADCLAFDELAQSIFHRPNAPRDSDFVVLLMAQGLDLAGSRRCSMVQPNGHCSIHGDRKPLACLAVPLDPFVPDRMQQLVLAERQGQAMDARASCVRRSHGVGFLPLVRGASVVAPAFLSALERRRADLAADKHLWGKAAFAQLEQSLQGQPPGLRQLPETKMLVMSIVPALLVFSGLSLRCRERCIEFIQAQLELIERTLATLPHDNATASSARAHLAGFSNAYWALGQKLTRESPGNRCDEYRHEPRDIGAWLDTTQKATALET
jgi:hypothetical protein